MPYTEEDIRKVVRLLYLEKSRVRELDQKFQAASSQERRLKKLLISSKQQLAQAAEQKNLEEELAETQARNAELEKGERQLPLLRETLTKTSAELRERTKEVDHLTALRNLLQEERDTAMELLDELSDIDPKEYARLQEEVAELSSRLEAALAYGAAMHEQLATKDTLIKGSKRVALVTYRGQVQAHVRLLHEKVAGSWQALEESQRQLAESMGEVTRLTAQLQQARDRIDELEGIKGAYDQMSSVFSTLKTTLGDMT